jgi:hypothetical protein
MGFSPTMPEHVRITEPPNPKQLRLIREVIDPRSIYMG